MQQALGAQATAIRSQSYYLDVTPPGQDKGTFVEAMAKRLGISTDAIATIGDMQNDLAMFKVSGLSVAMGNATDDVKKQAIACHRLRTRTKVSPGRSIFILKQTPTLILRSWPSRPSATSPQDEEFTSTAASPASRPASWRR